MYRLIYPGGGNTGTACQLNPPDENWGCTWFDKFHYPPDQVRPYPYATNPATVPIETDYLLDVVPQELPTYYHSTALQAQAIAARTYAYWHINQGSTINNSTQFQAFIPYKFESLYPATFPDNSSDPCASSNLNTAQHIVCGAVAPRHYISYDGDLPAFTEYTSDVYDHTVSHPQQGTLYPYLLGVDNPISTACDASNYGHYRGMSQEGASRWARGNQCSYATQGDMPWSVRWQRAEQILVHYYTGVRIRDANTQILTPADRWDPLGIDWGTSDNHPPPMDHGGSYPITVQVQNTGLSDWTCDYPNFSFALRYRWAKVGFGEVTSTHQASACGTAKGDPSPTLSLTIDDIPDWGPDAYTIRFDIYVTSASGNFWFSDYGWPTYDVGVCVDGECKVFIPLVLKNYGG
ncbi:MAG: SpoIID/LytB domain-containing protein [Anaerolineae bacterium]